MPLRMLPVGDPSAVAGADTAGVIARAQWFVRLAVCCFILLIALSVAGCSNQGSSNGQTAHCGSSNYSPAGLTSPANHPARDCLPPRK